MKKGVIRSKNLEKNVKKVIKFCEKSSIIKAQDELDFNLKIGGVFFIKALRLGIYDKKGIDTAKIIERYKGINQLEFRKYKQEFLEEFKSIKYLIEEVFPYLIELNKCLDDYSMDLTGKIHSKNVYYILNIYCGLVLKGIHEMRDATDITVFLDAFSYLIRKIDFKYILKIIIGKRNSGLNNVIHTWKNILIILSKN